ncbi:pseudouridine synthase rsua/rlub/c/d/e/f [Trichococcus palustris]|jgi:23S rRNA pseudouridine2605 synthase|uniref:Pseudouridine synthase n=1 Tax=Trichococcus palustris TaxID=140314 RepID=A0A143Y757_9LACT|nr:pseudouridine synthase [Trichococcus palustris]CZQ83504.1 pseudouridine synthase rsua/rlub/c/d/e/f [Trichococcus palustris]SFK69976.1 23S rRNA pseudouridine2605 synthase [Trichococcus palustris]
MERLQKVIAHAGIASRRKAEEMITEGLVTVNGEVVKELGVKVSKSDRVEVKGMPIYREQPAYYLFYKPKNTLSSVKDDKDRTVVTDFFNVKERIYPIGRLDFDTTGLLLMTNDGEFANLLTHPKYHIEKTYVAKVSAIPTRAQLNKLENGVILDGKKTSKARTKLISANSQKNTAIVEITIHEGWNHQVKRMFEQIGCPVEKLKREAFGFLTLGDLKPGEYRELNAFEVEKLKKIALSNEADAKR